MRWIPSARYCQTVNYWSARPRRRSWSRHRERPACGARRRPNMPGSASEALLTCRGTASLSTRRSVLIDPPKRHQQRHADFFRQWSFATDYNDHFETPRIAYTHIAPILHAIGDAKDKEALRLSKQNGNGSSAASSSSSSMRVYDPYYCKGSMVECLTSAIAGLTSSSSNQSASSASATPTAGGGGRMPPQHQHHQHDRALPPPPPATLTSSTQIATSMPTSPRTTCRNMMLCVTNPPYRVTNGAATVVLAQRMEEERRKEYRLAGGDCFSGCGISSSLPTAASILVVDTEYWRAFLSDADGLCDGAGAEATEEEEKRPHEPQRERQVSAWSSFDGGVRCGVFYIFSDIALPLYAREATGHSSRAFHAIWVCGGWVHDRARRQAMRSLKDLRARGEIEVFRDARMLKRRAGRAARK